MSSFKTGFFSHSILHLTFIWVVVHIKLVPFPLLSSIPQGRCTTLYPFTHQRAFGLIQVFDNYK